MLLCPTLREVDQLLWTSGLLGLLGLLGLVRIEAIAALGASLGETARGWTLMGSPLNSKRIAQECEKKITKKA